MGGAPVFDAGVPPLANAVLFARPRLYVDVHGQVLCGRLIGAKNRCPLFRITLKDRPIFLFPRHAQAGKRCGI
jgi:hypothetical protein